MADVQQDVHVLLVFKIVVEAHNILMMKLSVNLYFACKLLASFTFEESSLGNYF